MRLFLPFERLNLKSFLRGVLFFGILKTTDGLRFLAAAGTAEMSEDGGAHASERLSLLVDLLALLLSDGLGVLHGTKIPLLQTLAGESVSIESHKASIVLLAKTGRDT